MEDTLEQLETKILPILFLVKKTISRALVHQHNFDFLLIRNIFLDDILLVAIIIDLWPYYIIVHMHSLYL